MVWTAAQTTAFFTHADQMGLPAATWAAMQEEGINNPDDLIDFGKDEFKAMADNFRRPAAGDPVVHMPAKSMMRLVYASHCVRYYQLVGRTTSHTNMLWEPVLRNFKTQYDILFAKKDADAPEVPKLSARSLPVIPWSESLADYLAQIVGDGPVPIPLPYIIRSEVERPNPCPDIAEGKPHAAIYASIEEELIARAPHTGPYYRENNQAVYFKVEEALRSTAIASSIKPFQSAKNGRGAYNAVLAQNAGEAKWLSEIDKAEATMSKVTWKGNGSYLLEKFIGQHRAAYNRMERASHHTPYQLPDGATRVRHLLAMIESSDARLNAAMASIENDKTADGPKNDFEKAAELLIPADPVARKRGKTAGEKRELADISGVEGEDMKPEAKVSALNVKSGRGKTGVELRFHTTAEYHKLSPEQKKELADWRKTDAGRKTMAEQKGKGKSHSNVDIDAKVAAAIKKNDAKKAKEEKETEEETAKVFAMLKEIVPGGGVTWKNPISESASTSASSTYTALKSLASVLARKAKN